MKRKYILFGGATLFIFLSVYIERRTKIMKKLNGEIIATRPKPMTNAEKEELVNRINGMDQEELELLVETIPLEMCLERIKKEIDKVNKFQESLDEAMSIVGKKFF